MRGRFATNIKPLNESTLEGSRRGKDTTKREEERGVDDMILLYSGRLLGPGLSVGCASAKEVAGLK